MRHDVYEIICSTDTPLLVAKGKKDEIKIAPFRDVKNGALVISNAIKNVFSPISGSSLKREGDTIETLSSSELSELKEVAHCKCGASLMTTADLADSLGKHDLYCVVCGQKIEQEEPSEEDDEDVELDVEESCDDTESDDDDEVEVEVEESCDDMESDDEADDSEDEVEESSDDEEDEEIEIEDDEASEDVEESSDDEDEVEVDVEDDANSDEAIDDAEIEESCGDEPEDVEVEDEELEVESSDEEPEESEEDVELEVEEDDDEDDGAEESCVKFNCLSSVDKVRDLELVKCENGYRVLVNSNPVASAFKNLAKTELNVLFNDVNSLTKALSAAVSENGFSKEVCASFGIKPLMVKINVNEAAKQRLNVIEASVKKSYEEKQSDFIERFKQSMSIASVGVNKGLYGSNLLAQAFIKSLAASGQEDAEDVVNEILSKYGESYLKQIIDKANELVSKSDDVRNETASLVKAATFSKTKAVNLAHTAVEVQPKVEAKVETTASVTNRYSNLF